MTHTVVLGAGPGGLTVATELAARLPPGHQVTLVDEKDRFMMGLAKLGILDGRRTRNATERPLRDVERKGVRFLNARVEHVDPAARTVRVAGQTLMADHLVLAMGARLDAAAVPGMAQAGRNLYAVDGVEALHADLAALRSGTDVLVLVAGLPFKCPPAPYEAAMLAQAFLRARGVDARVTVATPEPQPLPVAGPECGATVTEYLDERGVEFLPNRKVVEVDAAGRVARFDGGETRRFDVLAFVPPHRAPLPLVEAGLTDASGFVPVDARTLQTKHADVYAVGDCNVVKLANGKPLVKAGVMAEGEGRVVAENLAARILGQPPRAAFDGKGFCFLELGGGLAMEVTGDFYATPAPRVVASAPTRRSLESKASFESERLQRWLG